MPQHRVMPKFKMYDYFDIVIFKPFICEKCNYQNKGDWNYDGYSPDGPEIWCHKCGYNHFMECFRYGHYM